MNCYQPYTDLLSKYLDEGNSESLLQAKELGDEIVSQGLAMSPLLVEHHQLLQKILAQSDYTQFSLVVDRANQFLHEVFAAFDRSYLDTLNLNKEIEKNNHDMREAQSEARKAYQKMTSLIENLPAGAVYIEDDFVMVNRAVEELLGCDRSEIHDLRDWFALMFSHEAENKLALYKQNKKTGRSVFETLSFLRKDGLTKHLQYSIYRENNFEIWLLLDVTEKIKADIKLGQSSKMASLGQMAAGLAHEINNPLAIIKGKVQLASQLIGKGPTSLASAQKHLLAAEQTVDRIAKIIKGLRSFSRDSSGDPFSSVHLKQVIDETVSFCGARFTNFGVKLLVELDKDDVVVDCRPVEISQVLLNLLNNAFDAVYEVNKQANNEHKDNWVKLTTKIVGDAVEIAVIDSGAGIPDSIKLKLMQPFFTTKEVGKGTGLGLSICRGIVEGHSGKFYLDEQSVNTKFVMLLPFKHQQTRSEKSVLKVAGGF